MPLCAEHYVNLLNAMLLPFAVKTIISCTAQARTSAWVRALMVDVLMPWRQQCIPVLTPAGAGAPGGRAGAPREQPGEGRTAANHRAPDLHGGAQGPQGGP